MQQRLRQSHSPASGAGQAGLRWIKGTAACSHLRACLQRSRAAALSSVLPKCHADVINNIVRRSDTHCPRQSVSSYAGACYELGWIRRRGVNCMNHELRSPKKQARFHFLGLRFDTWSTWRKPPGFEQLRLAYHCRSWKVEARATGEGNAPSVRDQHAFHRQDGSTLEVTLSTPQPCACHTRLAVWRYVRRWIDWANEYSTELGRHSAYWSVPAYDDMSEMRHSHRRTQQRPVSCTQPPDQSIE